MHSSSHFRLILVAGTALAVSLLAFAARFAPRAALDPVEPAPIRFTPWLAAPCLASPLLHALLLPS